ncbi:hypothetical protein D3C81_1779400 [compost metagenome]
MTAPGMEQRKPCIRDHLAGHPLPLQQALQQDISVTDHAAAIQKLQHPGQRPGQRQAAVVERMEAEALQQADHLIQNSLVALQPAQGRFLTDRLIRLAG